MSSFDKPALVIARVDVAADHHVGAPHGDGQPGGLVVNRVLEFLDMDGRQNAVLGVKGEVHGLDGIRIRGLPEIGLEDDLPVGIARRLLGGLLVVVFSECGRPPAYQFFAGAEGDVHAVLPEGPFVIVVSGIVVLPGGVPVGHFLPGRVGLGAVDSALICSRDDVGARRLVSAGDPLRVVLEVGHGGVWPPEPCPRRKA